MIKDNKNLDEVPRSLALTSKKSAKFRNKNGSAKYFAPYRVQKILENVDLSGFDFSMFSTKDELCPKLFSKNEKLHPEVRNKMIEISKEFYSTLKTNVIPKDIYFIGSAASYNWHEKSDIDIHIVIDFSEFSIDKEFLEEFFIAKKNNWSLNHNIKLYNHDVELYVQDIDHANHSSGIYSLLKNSWLKKPEKKISEFSKNSILNKAANIMNMIDSVIKIEDKTVKSRKLDKIRDKIRDYRQKGLDSDKEEFSQENIVFKILRSCGYLDKMKDVKKNAIDSKLTLNEEIINENDYNNLYIDENLSLDDEKIETIKDFISFTRDMIGIETTINVFLHKEKNENLITTASYLPFKNENHIRAGGRALVDILRSIAHELTHNRQRELNLFNPGDEVQNIGGTIENEANSIAGILIKDFSHNHGYGHIYERKEISGKKIL